MASTTFIDNQTVIYAAWLNDVNNAVYNGIFVSPSITATSMICNGTASGAGFTNLINNTFTAPGPIGSVTPSTGRFTTLTATSLSVTSITGLTTPLSIGQGGTGLSSAGTSGYALASNGSGLTYKKLGLGITGEVWNNVLGSRSIGSSYTNSNAYPIMVCVTMKKNGGNNSTASISVVVNSITILNPYDYVGNNIDSQGSIPVTFIVPPGQTYSVSGQDYLTTWTELY